MSDPRRDRASGSSSSGAVAEDAVATAPEPPPMAKRATASVIWMTASKWAGRLGGMATIVLLTRMLSPEDFGVAATVTTLLPLVYVFSDAGFSTYIVQSDEADEQTLDTAFWFSLAAGLLLTGAVAGCSPLLGVLFQLPEAVPLLQAASLSVAIIAVGSVPTAILQRRMSFRLLAGVQVVATLVAQVAAVAVAFSGAGAWALIAQVLVSQGIGTAAVWALAKWRPRLSFSARRFREMALFGLHVAGSTLVLVVRYWAWTAIVVAVIGVREMGFLSVAQRLVQTAEDLTMAALATVSVAAFARLRASPDRLRSSYLRGISITYAVAMPLMLFLGVAAPVLVPFLFGEDKVGSVVVIAPLAACAVLGAGLALDQGLFQGAGRPGPWFAFLVISQIVSVPVLLWFAAGGLRSFAMGMLTMAILDTVVRCVMVGRLIGARPWDAARPLVTVLLPAALAACAGWLVLFGLHGRADAPQVPALVILAAVGVTVVGAYLLLLRLLLPRLTSELTSLLPDRVSARFRRVLTPSRPADA